MLRIAGRYADAYFPSFPHRPVDYKQRLDVVRSAASDAGRDPMSIIPAMQLFVVAGRTRADVDEALDSEVLRAFGLNASDEVFARHGARHPLGAGFSGGQDLLSHAAAVRPSIMREILLNGTADEVIEQAAQWRDNGVRYLVLINAGVMQRSLRKALASILPFNKIVRGIKKL
jgi:phthiodiolone/phenolphthiodiolone dimycocerosates ketoreductase